MRQLNRPGIATRLIVALSLGALLWGAMAFTRSTFAAEEPAAGAKQADPSAKDAADKAEQALKTVFKKESAPAAPPMKSIDWFEMIWKGGPLMIPIGIMSVVVVAFTIERIIGLRRKKVI